MVKEIIIKECNEEITYMVDNKHVFQIKNKKIYLIFFLMILSSVLLNMSNGSFINCIDLIKEDLNITNDFIKGLLTSMFSWGLVAGKFF
jgi:hypothetical protein